MPPKPFIPEIPSSACYTVFSEDALCHDLCVRAVLTLELHLSVEDIASDNRRSLRYACFVVPILLSGKHDE